MINNAEQQAICDAIDVFARAMKKKMLQKHEEGYRGWDKPEFYSNFENGLLEHARSTVHDPKQAVDAANFCMMIHYHKGNIP